MDVGNPRRITYRVHPVKDARGRYLTRSDCGILPVFSGRQRHSRSNPREYKLTSSSPPCAAGAAAARWAASMSVLEHRV